MNEKWHYFKYKQSNNTYRLWRYTEIDNRENYINLQIYDGNHNKWIPDYNTNIHIDDEQITTIEAFQVMQMVYASQP